MRLLGYCFSVSVAAFLFAACGDKGDDWLSKYPGLIVKPECELETSESGTTNTVSVALTKAPPEDITITVTSLDLTEVTVSPSTLTFTPLDWDIEQPVTLTGVDDDVIDGTQIASVSFDYKGLKVETLNVQNTDDDEAGITVSKESLTVEENSTATESFTVVPNTQPEDDDEIVVTVISEDTGEATVDYDTLIFNSLNWDTPQTVTVSSVDDDVIDGDKVVNITLSASTSTASDYSDVSINPVSVTVIDDDVSGGSEDDPDDPAKISCNSPFAGTVDKNLSYYSYYMATSITAGSSYIVSMTGLSDDMDLYVYEDSAFSVPVTCNPDNTRNWYTIDEDCTFTPTGNEIFIMVDGSWMGAHNTGATYTLNLTCPD